MQCPRCDGQTQIKVYEGVEIDRCQSCHGTWLDDGELTKIISTKEEQFSQGLIQETLTTATSGVPVDEKRVSVKCPKCGQAMIPINYSYSSGVIIDRCTAGHGLWLDKTELEKVQAHVEHWDKEIQENKEDWILLAKSVNENHEKASDENRKRSMRPTKYLVNSIIRKLIG
jgi:Zn-finger nucleic acid-binding protein